MATKMKNKNTHASSNSHFPARAIQEMRPAAEDLLQRARDFARENPESAALWCFGIGFILGWKMKMW